MNTAHCGLALECAVVNARAALSGYRCRGDAWQTAGMSHGARCLGNTLVRATLHGQPQVLAALTDLPVITALTWRSEAFPSSITSSSLKGQGAVQAIGGISSDDPAQRQGAG